MNRGVVVVGAVVVLGGLGATVPQHTWTPKPPTPPRVAVVRGP